MASGFPPALCAGRPPREPRSQRSRACRWPCLPSKSEIVWVAAQVPDTVPTGFPCPEPAQRGGDYWPPPVRQKGPEGQQPVASQQCAKAVRLHAWRDPVVLALAFCLYCLSVPPVPLCTHGRTPFVCGVPCCWSLHLTPPPALLEV